jgi:hypothetical protein
LRVIATGYSRGDGRGEIEDEAFAEGEGAREEGVQASEGSRKEVGKENAEEGRKKGCKEGCKESCEDFFKEDSSQKETGQKSGKEVRFQNQIQEDQPALAAPFIISAFPSHPLHKSADEGNCVFTLPFRQ